MEEATQKRSWGKTAGLVAISIATILGVALVSSITRRVVRDLNQPSPERQLQDALQVAKAQIQAKLPQQVDNITTLVNVSAYGRTLTYHYVLQNETVNIASAEQRVRENVCRSEPGTVVRAGAMLIYEYRGPPPGSRLLGTIVIDRCG